MENVIEALAEQYADRLSGREVEVLDGLIEAGDGAGALTLLLDALVQGGEAVSADEVDELTELGEDLGVDTSALDEVEVG